MKTNILLILTFLILSCSREEKKCTIAGGISGGDSKAILLFKASKFPVYEAEIPVSNNLFMYTFNFRTPEVYWLIPKEKFHKSVINEIPFVSEGGRKIEVSINVSNGGYDVDGPHLNKALLGYYRELNQRFLNESLKYQDSVNTMYRNGSIFNKDFKELQDALEKTKDQEQRNQIMNTQWEMKNAGRMYSPRAKRYVEMQDSILKAQKSWEADYISSNTSIPAYYLFMKNIKGIASGKKGKKVDAASVEEAKRNLERFTVEFPGHPYETIVKNTLEGLQNIYDGGKYIDFEGSNAKGENVKLSDAMKNNKLTLLNFWAPWSEFTIKSNKKYIPVYNEYKDKGFGIVGITHVYGEPDEAIKIIEKENYPWANLIDKDNAAGVWEKYNLSNQSGGTLLVDSSGKIVAVDPTIDELKEKLAELLK